MREAAKWRLGRQSQVPGTHGGGPAWLFGSAVLRVGREEEVLLSRAGSDHSGHLCPSLGIGCALTQKQ